MPKSGKTISLEFALTAMLIVSCSVCRVLADSHAKPLQVKRHPMNNTWQ